MYSCSRVTPSTEGSNPGPRTYCARASTSWNSRDPEALPGAVVLGDERRRQGRGGRHDVLATHHRHGAGGAYAVRVERRVLGDLADLEPQRPAAVEHPPVMAFEPGQHRRRVLRPEPVVPGMGRGAHPVVEHAVGRRGPEVDDPGVEEPLVERQPARVEGRAQRLDPFVVLVEDVDSAHAAAARKSPLAVPLPADRPALPLHRADA